MKTTLDVLKGENLNIVLQCTRKNPTIKKMWEYVAGMEFNLLSPFNRDII